MTFPQLALVALLLILAIITIAWLIRSRGNRTGTHIDMTVTALGAVTEAVEDLVDIVTHKVESVEEALVGDADPIPAANSPVRPLPGGGDNLRLMKGVGPKLAALLNEIGVTHFAQIAAWGPDDVAHHDALLGNFKGRILRDDWIKQADFLAKGDIAGFEANFGKLDKA